MLPYPLWIDLYEVTNEQFEQFGGVAAQPGAWPNGKHPRTNVTWFEARDFCELRAARLPTEAEWEYAARGPDNLVFPWGNEFVADHVVSYETTDGDKAEVVGSRPLGVSWVGAEDMSGNVWELVSTAYDNIDATGEFPYPYDPRDGREDLGRSGVWRVLRGGSSYDIETEVMVARRFSMYPEFEDKFYGFRCAR
jgi:iron(II)-dependent oxidoreductase